MPFAAHLSTIADSLAALDDCTSHLGWEGPVDLAIAFYSPHHSNAAEALAAAIQERWRPRALIGCPGETVIGNGREVERGPALTMWLGRWGGDVQLTPFHLTVEETSEGYSILGWPDDYLESPSNDGALLTLADPFTFPVDDYLRRVNEEKPGLRIVGGMASGMRQPGDCRLLVNHQVVREGAVGVFLQGPLKLRTVVSQGCRPIGKPLVITKARDNLIVELGGKSPLAHLQELWEQLSQRDQELVQNGLHVGRVISEYRETFQRGDFLIRNVMGLDRESGALAITDRVRAGQTVQFHVRDAATADEDLRLMLQGDTKANPSAAAALLFSCNGRGTRLFGDPDHDARTVQAEKGPLPLAGFFAQGELGPVGGQNFIHGFTASLALFED